MSPEEIASYVMSVFQSTVTGETSDMNEEFSLLFKTAGVLIEQLTQMRKDLSS